MSQRDKENLVPKQDLAHCLEVSEILDRLAANLGCHGEFYFIIGWGQKRLFYCQDGVLLCRDVTTVADLGDLISESFVLEMISKCCGANQTNPSNQHFQYIPFHNFMSKIQQAGYGT